MTEIAEKQCAKCGHIKSVTEFRKVPMTFGGDGFSKCCAKCRKKMAAAKAAQNAAPATVTADDAPPPGAPAHEVGYSLGFKVHFEKGDFYVSQEHDGARVQVVLSVAEVDQLHAFRKRAVTEAA
jgi:hypothetical protein